VPDRRKRKNTWGTKVANIVIIDDSNFQRKIISKFVKAEGHETFEGANGKIGLELIATHKPDIILCDLVMPEVDGFEVLRILQERGSKIPIIILTADIQAPVREQCMQLGAKKFLNKPFNQGQMREALEEILGAGAEDSQ
jgi:CheY-like chemotaxis protein